MSSDRAWISERVIASVVLSLALAVPLALVLGLFGADGSFIVRLGAALTIEYVLVFGVAEGVQIAFERLFEAPDVLHVSDEQRTGMPEAEQHLRGS